MPQGYTTVVYGEVKFFRCQTRLVDQVPEWDESHTLVSFVRTKIAISGYMNGLNTTSSYMGGGGYSKAGEYAFTSDGTTLDPNGYASKREQQIRRKLGPRQPFSLIVGDPNGDGLGGTPLIYCNPAPENTLNANAPGMSPPQVVPTRYNTGVQAVNLSHIDLNNGPKVTGFKITGVHGDTLFMVDAEFEICHLECDEFGNVPNNTFGVLSNRWSTQDSYDANTRTTRTYTGTLRLASQINAQQLRWICLPPLVRMFRREHFEFYVSEDGLTMKWTVVDQEIANSAPYPAKTMALTSSTVAENAMQVRQTCDVNLTGDVNTNRRDLIELALYLMCVKIFGQTPAAINAANLAGDNGVGAINANQYLVTSLEFVDYVGDDVHVSARMSALAPNRGDTTSNWMQAGANFAKELDPNLIRNTALTTNGRPNYDRTYSLGAYPIGAISTVSGASFPGDKTAYASPGAPITQIFLNYMQTACNDIHATYNGPGTPGPNIRERNYEIGDNNQSPYVDVSGSTYNITIMPTNSPALVSNPYVSEGQKVSSYSHWQIQNLYKTKTMRIQMPIANVPFPDDPRTGPQAQKYNLLPTSAVVQLAGGQSRRIVRVEASRIGSEPEFPDINTWFATFIASVSPGAYSGSYDSGNSNIDQVPRVGSAGAVNQIYQWPLYKKIRPSTVTTTVTGQSLYHAVAEYHIALSREPNPGERLELGNNMWDNLGKQATDKSGNLTMANWESVNGRVVEFAPA